MATYLNALTFREMFGRQLRRPDRGQAQAYIVAPLDNTMNRSETARMIEMVRRSLVRCVDYGEVYYVTREMTEYMTSVIDQHLKGEHVFHLSQGDMPSLTGFVYFDGSIPLPTVYSPTGYHNLRAVLWDQYAIVRDEPGKKSPIYYGDAPTPHEPEVIGKILYSVTDAPNPQQWEMYGPWKMRHWIPAEYEVRLDGRMIESGFDTANGLIRNDSRYRDLALTDEQIEQDKLDTRVAIDTLFKILRVWTRVIQQEIPVRHPRPSAYDKVMHKEGRPPADVQVTHLRRYENKPPTGLVEVDWAYRWKVKGHHRWQRVGPGRAFLRQVWVKEYTKGPADKPLVERDKLTSLDR